VASLTPREREVLTLVVAGSPNKTIAYDLGASPRTIEVHRARVMEKMGARNLAELVRMMIAAPPGDAVPLDGVAPPGGAARKPAGG
jgi:two-component system response regulator FixJ